MDGLTDGKTLWTELLYNKSFPLHGQINQMDNIILSASQFAWFPASIFFFSQFN